MKRAWILALAATITASSAGAVPLSISEIVNTTTTSTGYLVADGLDDAFDGYASIQSMPAGISVARNIATLEAIRTYRVLDSFTNVTGGTISGTITYYTNLGSDRNETVLERGADRTLTFEDRVRPNRSPVGDNDPVLGFLYGDGSAATGSAVSSARGNVRRGAFYLTVDFTLAAGESFSFLQFATLYKDNADRSGDVTQTIAILDAIAANPYAGTALSARQVASVANFSASSAEFLTPVPLPAGAPLLLTGLGVLGFAFRRRKG